MDKLSSYWKEISVYLTAPVQICLIVVVAYFIRRILRGRKEPEEPKVEEKHEVLEPMKKRDFYLEELKEYDGLKSKRILIGVNGKVFDVTRGKNFYGPGKVKEEYKLQLTFKILVCINTATNREKRFTAISGQLGPLLH